ncbi:hypothetical protein BOTCAL_0047g00340 [Botryotinia calthae]|uniref:Uncharacterized protein n=1 Tax=Botryotinia calthae TaxID=38488 RepID=A0A4Y8DBB8_9HELO|nr:hypothetical protein BOTCAL_0047g00340 [Botryotinia calthae]
MARTAAGRAVFTSAMKLQIDELEDVISRLIATRDLDIPTIQEKSEIIQAEIEERQEEKENTMSRIVAALRILPGHNFRRLFISILRDNPVNQQLLVARWEEQFGDLDTEFEGDPFSSDPYALFAYMNEKSTITLRLFVSLMAGMDSSLREGIKNALLTTLEDGTLEINIFDPFEREQSPEIELAPRSSRTHRMFLPEPSVVDDGQSLRDTSSDWDVEETVFVRESSKDSYVSDTTPLRDTSSDWDVEEKIFVREASEDSYVSHTTPLRDTSSDWDKEETVFVRDASEDSYGSDITISREDASPDIVEDSEFDDEPPLKKTCMRDPFEVTDISGWTDGQEAIFRAH